MFAASEGHRALVAATASARSPISRPRRPSSRPATPLEHQGMFVFRISSQSGHLERLMPELWREMQGLAPTSRTSARSTTASRPEPGLRRDRAPRRAVCVIPCDLSWSDVGELDEVARLSASGANVSSDGDGDDFVFAHGDRSTAWSSFGPHRRRRADALLITARCHARVKRIDRPPRGRRAPQGHRARLRAPPWGSFEVLRDSRSSSRRSCASARGSGSTYQCAPRTSGRERWVVVAGRPEVVLDGELLRPRPGEAVFIPRGARRRIQNPGGEMVEIVEVQLAPTSARTTSCATRMSYDRS